MDEGGGGGKHTEQKHYGMRFIHLCQNSYDNMIHSVQFSTWFCRITYWPCCSTYPWVNAMCWIFVIRTTHPVKHIQQTSTKLNAYIYEKNKIPNSQLEASYVCYTWVERWFYCCVFLAFRSFLKNHLSSWRAHSFSFDVFMHRYMHLSYCVKC